MTDEERNGSTQSLQTDTTRRDQETEQTEEHEHHWNDHQMEYVGGEEDVFPPTRNEEFEIDSDNEQVHPEEVNRRKRIITHIANQGGMAGVTHYYLRLRVRQLNDPVDNTYYDIIDELTEDSIIVQLP
ncbi:hypothetical protein AVEN_84909-1 [Araneus ventricosus]|uniref:Uncharacterized protein n=1 Tax=Araneus ventricosus TaxID=182803 RepID=A0A4Y2R8Y8_ARAVE|nr:hypothetical protein AVEN_84909-1 [Araneus ventricosus]